MKTMLRLLAAVLALVLLSGCTTLNLQKLVPEISASELEWDRAGNVSKTHVHIVGLVTTATEVTAESIDISHSNTWVPRADLKIRNYRRARTGSSTASPEATP